METLKKQSSRISQFSGFPLLGKIWKRLVPKNDEDPSNTILNILDMGSISTRKHEWIFGSMVPISTRKHEMEFW